MIQPLNGPSAHLDWLERHGEGPHHVGIVVDSVRETTTQMETAGYPLIHYGAGLGPRNDGAWAYFDTTEALGLLIEVVEPPTNMPSPSTSRPTPSPGPRRPSSQRKTRRTHSRSTTIVANLNPLRASPVALPAAAPPPSRASAAFATASP